MNHYFPNFGRLQARMLAACLFVICTVLAVSISSTSVHAFGISPAKSNHDIAPGDVIEGHFAVLDAESIRLRPQGYLEDSVFIGSPERANGHLIVPYKIFVPVGGLQQGTHTLRIFAEEPKNAEGISANIALGYTIYLNVPYNSSHIDAAIASENANGSTLLLVTLKNVGVLPAHSVAVSTTVEEAGAALVHSSSAVDDILPGESRSAIIDIDRLQPGVYNASAKIAYEDKEAAVSEQIAVGLPGFSVVSSNAALSKGSVGNVQLTLSHDWNEACGIEARAELINSDGTAARTARTPRMTAGPREHVLLEFVFDVSNAVPGDYDVLVTVDSCHGTLLEAVPVRIGKGGLSLKKDDSALAEVMGAMIVLLAVVAMLLVFILMRRRKR